MVKLNLEGLTRILILFFPVVGLVLFAYGQTPAELLIAIDGLSQAEGSLDMLTSATRGLAVIPLFMALFSDAFCSIEEEIVICEYDRVGWQRSFKSVCYWIIVLILVVSFIYRGNATPMEWLIHMIQFIG